MSGVLGWWVAGVGLYSGLVLLVERQVLGYDFVMPTGVHTLLGLVLGMLLVWRTNTAYDRWWEGRRLWGQLVNDLRNLAVKVAALSAADPADKECFGLRLIEFPCALRDHLRRREPGPHRPAEIARELYRHLKTWKSQGFVDGFEETLFDRQLSGLLDVCGASERIRNTPVVRSLRNYVRQCILLYLLVLPWTLDDRLFTVCLVMVVAYFMVGIELIAEAIEEPFGTEKDDLPLDDICRGIEVSLRQILTLPAEDGARAPGEAARDG
ncbi:MAG TPA: bestrophin family ion channel [Candidatus Nitrosotenuis sp.]|jgi:putative membrane protein|nr:bestrophin family ion channel [Candidatus Nitrosotenuis sp.]